MRSLSALAVCLSLTSITSARVANAPSEVDRRAAGSKSDPSIWNLFGLLRRAAAATCYMDEYYDFVTKQPFGPEFCSAFMDYPNTTTTVGFTPVSKFYHTYSTQYIRTESDITTIPASTVTVTASPIEQRDAAPETTPAPFINRARLEEALARFRRQVGNVTVSSSAMSASFSSACSCHKYGGPTITATTTASPRVVTVSAFFQGTTTTSGTVTAGTVTTTVTASAATATSDPIPEEAETSGLVSEVVSSTTSSGPGPAPTAPAFKCPEDHNTTVSQLVGPERYDYLVLCDTDIPDEDFYDTLSYSSYSQCAAACSVANQRFDLPVCQGFSFYEASNLLGFNCFLKTSAEITVYAVGVDSGVLQSIAVGVNSSSPSGTNTESGPFPEQTTINPSIASRSMSEILAGSTTSIDVVAPGSGPVIPGTGLLVNAQPITSYSTYISDGSTFSTGTVFSTMIVNPDGSWYYTYYSSWSQSWASATTVYASSETSTSISNSSSSDTDVHTGGPNGVYWMVTTTNYTYYYPGGYNVTQVIANETYAANGTEIGAATTTYYWVYSTGGAGGERAGGPGAPSSVSAGIVTSATASTSVSTQIIVSGGSGGQAGGEGGGGSLPVQTPPPPSVITNTFSTAGSTGSAASGSGGGGGGASSTQASGAPGSSVTVISGGPSPISSTIISGGTGSAFSTGASGAPSSGPSLTPISSTVISGGTGSAFSTGASGAPSSGPSLTPISSTVISGGTAGATSTGGSGFSNSNDNRSFTQSTTVPLPTGTIPSSGALFTPISATSGVTGTGGASSTGVSGQATSAPSGTGSSPFSAPSGPRSATDSTTTTLRTGSVPFSAPSGPRSATDSTTTSLRTGSVPFSAPSGPRSATDSTTTSLRTGSVPFSAPSGPRSATDSTTTSLRTGSVPFSAPSGPRSATDSTSSPLGTSSLPFSAPSGPRSATDSTSTTWGTAPTVPIGTAPSSDIPPPGSLPPGTAPLSSGVGGTTRTEVVSIATGSLPLSPPASTAVVPTVSVLTSSGSAPFSAPSGPRTATWSSSDTAPLSTGTFPPFPTGTSPTTCVTNMLGTTTIFTTVTEYGCYSNCPPLSFGPYGNKGGPPTFGGLGRGP